MKGSKRKSQKQSKTQAKAKAKAKAKKVAAERRAKADESSGNTTGNWQDAQAGVSKRSRHGGRDGFKSQPRSVEKKFWRM